MRICLFNNIYTPIRSGSTYFVSKLAKRLKRKGHEVVVVTSKFKGQRSEEVIDGIKVYRLPCLRIPRFEILHNFQYFTYTFSPVNLYRIYKIIKRHRCEILQVHGQIFDLLASAVIMAKIMHLPLVLVIHTYIYHTNRFYNFFVTLFDKLVIKQFVKRCVVPAGDTYSINYIRDTYGIDPMFAPLIIHPMDLKAVKVDKRTIQHTKEKYMVKKELIVSLGHVHNLRDRVEIIRSMPYVIKKFPDVKLLIVGDVYTQKSVRLVKELSLEKNVSFTGALPRDEALRLLLASDVEAHGLTLQLGLGKAATEAMALGKPILANVDKDFLGKGVLKNWGNIILVRPGNVDDISAALVKLLADKKLSKKIGGSAAKLIRNHFTWENTYRQFENVYSHVLKKNKKT
ncbi:glycosyltransferase family 4 protein [Candidatus Woesearchaeota archaeon]|nr:glycosyltransferase family 4 protein [Candidatus Woesearchaeota archaeon]